MFVPYSTLRYNFLCKDLHITVGPLTVDYKVLFCVLFATSLYLTIDYDTVLCKISILMIIVLCTAMRFLCVLFSTLGLYFSKDCNVVCGL